MAILVEYKMLDGRLHCYASDNEKPLFCDFIDLSVRNPENHDWVLFAYKDLDSDYTNSYKNQKVLVFYTAQAYRVIFDLYFHYTRKVVSQ